MRPPRHFEDTQGPEGKAPRVKRDRERERERAGVSERESERERARARSTTEKAHVQSRAKQTQGLTLYNNMKTVIYRVAGNRLNGGAVCLRVHGFVGC